MKPINVPTVPLKHAQLSISRFRDRLVKSAVFPVESLPKAILIPIEDLQAIMQKYNTVTDNGDVVTAIQGVRAYFAIKETDKALPDPITALIVPVDLDGNDIIYNGVQLGEDDPETEIYDFTKPCPDSCDPDSPLYQLKP
ncbi:MAG: hypothetical protein EOO90_11455 [Pedobacter sp.]|nr:MAG: hypothetical protein EOO90_11455 [Pedobacter sp.]